MTKRAPGTGSVTKLPSGRFRARVPIHGERLDLGTFGSEDDADGAIAATLLEAPKMKLVSKACFGGWVPRWLDRLELSGYAAMKTARSIFRVHVPDAPFWDWPLGSISARQIREWLQRLSRSGVSASYVRQTLVLLRRCFEDAMLDGLIDTNPVREVRAPKMRAPTDEPWTWLNADEQRRLLTSPKVPEAWRVMIAFAIGTGIRQGEQWCLRREDLILDGDTPHVVVRFGSAGRAPKNRKIRRVPLFGLGLTAARQWTKIAPQWCPTWEAQELVFPGQRGGRQKVSRVPGWKEWIAAAGITRRVRWHDLRHTCAASLVSGLWGPAWRLDEVRDLLGHHSVTMTERYAHLSPDALLAAASRVGSRRGSRAQNSEVKTTVSDLIGVSDGN